MGSTREDMGVAGLRRYLVSAPEVFLTRHQKPGVGHSWPLGSAALLLHYVPSFTENPGRFVDSSNKKDKDSLFESGL